MLSFIQHITESVLFENRAWHQFVGQNVAKLLDRAGLSTHYASLADQPGHGTSGHVTDYLIGQLGMGDLNADEGRWVLKHLHGGGIQRGEDVASTVVPNLMRLRQAQAEGKSDATLARLQGAGALHGHLSKVYPAGESSLAHLDPSEYTVHGENEHWTIVQPHTKAAACALGKGTGWCTAPTGPTNRFHTYNNEGPLYTLIPKNPVRKGERYQIHVPEPDSEVQFMDENDDPVYSVQRWSPLSAKHHIQLTDEQQKAMNRPLPRLESTHAREALHGMRDLMDFILSKDKDVSGLSFRLRRGSKAGSPADAINSAMIDHLSRHSATAAPQTEFDIPKFGGQELQAALTKNGSKTAWSAARHLDQLGAASQRRILDDKTMEAMQTSSDQSTRLLAARKKWKPEHVMRAARDSDPSVAMHALPFFDAALERQITPEHIDALLEHPDYAVRDNVVNWGLQRQYRKDPITGESSLIKGTGKLTHDQISKLIADPEEAMRLKLAHPDHAWALSPTHVHMMLQHSKPVLPTGDHRYHPNIDPKKFDRSYLDRPFSPFSTDNANTRLEDIMRYNNKSLLGFLHASHNFRWIKDPKAHQEAVSQGRIFHNLITDQHITRALQNPDLYHPAIRQALLHHSQFNPAAHMSLARQNPDLDLRKTEHFPYGDPS
jgi:hypothetical protein